MSDIEFVDGMIVKAPHERAPDFVKGSISIQPEKLAAWLAQHQDEEWVNVDVKESRGGKWYASVNTYKREEPRATQPVKDCPQPDQCGFDDDDIPF